MTESNSAESQPQGGDTPSWVKLDLSTCVNPYGPPAAVVDALRQIPIEVIKRHPFDATRTVEHIYAHHLRVDVEQLVATRGASEAIWQLSRIGFDPVALPLPAYTEFTRAFPSARRIAGNNAHSVEQLERAAAQSTLVIISNPHNPSGQMLSRIELSELCKRFPDTGFVFDESYADFVGDDRASMLDTELDNVVVIRSPTKFYGIGGVRVGVVWTRNEMVVQSLRSQRTNWPLSNIEATVLRAAFDNPEWGEEAREKLADDALWLRRWLDGFDDIEIIDSALHFYLVRGNTRRIVDTLEAVGAHARSLDSTQGFDEPALRISAPGLTRRFVLEKP